MNLIKKERDSNMELLRLVAMFLVLVVHADFFSLGMPTYRDVMCTPSNAFMRFFFESLSFVCVNVFVLISGWFGICPNKRSFCKFVFQCLFFLVGIYVALLLTKHTYLSTEGVKGCLVMLQWNWFIKAYIGLYILAPTLNVFVQNADRNAQKSVLVSFFVFQTVYSWLNDAAIFFEQGYSTMSFIGLYLLARYIKVFKPHWAYMSSMYYLIAFGIFTFVLSVTAFFTTQVKVWRLADLIYLYVNPLVIVSSICLLLFFSGMRLKSKVVNRLASSSFAIFLLHTNPNLCKPYFATNVVRIYNAFDGIICLGCIMAFLIAVAFAAILIDQFRILLWNHIASKYL